MRTILKGALTVAFGVFASLFGYGLAVESVLPTWVVVVLVAGGFYGAVVGVLEAIDPFGPIRQRVVNFVLILGLLLLPVLYSSELMLVFVLGTSLVLFGMILQDTVTDVVETGDD